MKKIITIMIGCTLALAAGAIAQQDDAQATPGKKKKQQQKAEASAEGQPAAGQPAESSEARPPQGKKSPEQRAERRNARAERQANKAEGAKASTTAETAPATPDANTRPGKQKGRKAKAAMANESVDATTTAPDANTQPDKQRKGRNAKAQMKNQATATAPTETSVNGQTAAQSQTATQANQPKQANRRIKGQTKKVDVQAIKAQHANFQAQARPQQVPAVTFSQSHRISGADQWQGQQYSAFRSYQPQRHDQSYYRSHYSRVELIGGGYYYFNNGYWYPAWGYQPSAQYYVYDGPIYAGQSAERLDRVIANVQASLQAMGYYKGEVDGLLGPLTRDALNGYQADNRLYTTGTIDEPTLSSLGLG